VVLSVFKTVALSQARRGVGSTPMHSRHMAPARGRHGTLERLDGGDSLHDGPPLIWVKEAGHAARGVACFSTE